MSNLNIQARVDFGKEGYHVQLSLVEFQEDDNVIIYSPALDLSGYGYSKSEAKDSFNEALYEFFRYTRNKGTLERALEMLGWSIKGKKQKQFNPPKDSDLVTSNQLYNEIVNNKTYNVSRETITI